MEPDDDDLVPPLDVPDDSAKLFWAAMVLFTVLFLAQAIQLR